MEDFTPKRMPHWDYMWQDEKGQQFVGMFLFPERKQEGNSLFKIKKAIRDAFISKKYIPMTILYRNDFLNLDARVWEIDESESLVTLKDLEGNYYDVRISDIMHITHKRNERKSE
ncbi:hypothetical protein [Bacillus sp. 165]|uniref:hypothetical protein n=1 Tax=Bacillus sp. 165 TaxID=1529117 RepID=UPI001AD995FF|nr:hypothetical protein [Bacillus sp. 165]MBO9128431.1 hypothetical protein [Bacillus sp. 165]